jgi:hypothetical protein
MAFSLDVDVVLLDIGRFVPLSRSPPLQVASGENPPSGHVCCSWADNVCICRGNSVSHQLRQRCPGEQGFCTLQPLLPSRDLPRHGLLEPFRIPWERCPLGSVRPRSKDPGSSERVQVPFGIAASLQEIIKCENKLSLLSVMGHLELPGCCDLEEAVHDSPQQATAPCSFRISCTDTRAPVARDGNCPAHPSRRLVASCTRKTVILRIFSVWSIETCNSPRDITETNDSQGDQPSHSTILSYQWRTQFSPSPLSGSKSYLSPPPSPCMRHIYPAKANPFLDSLDPATDPPHSIHTRSRPCLMS